MMHHLVVSLRALTLSALFCLFLCGGALAATLVVDRTDDANVSACTAAVNDCSLRGAINAANAEASTITFDVGGIITLGSALPNLSDDITLSGPGANLLTVQPAVANAFNIFQVNSDNTANISGLTIGNGQSGIFNFGTVTATNCIFNSNTGISNGGTATITNCTFNGNSVGIDNGGTVAITNCIFSGNEAGIGNSSGATVTNCTFSGNGEGISSVIGAVTFTNCTFTGNTIGINNFNGAEVTLKNTLCVGNTNNVNDPEFAVIDGGGNITSGTAAAAGLDPTGLQDNGGPTATIALFAGGTAVNAGLNANVPGGITTDGRGSGFARIVGAAVDIGAFEVQPTISISDVTGGEGNSGTLNAAFTVTLSSASSQIISVNFATADGTASAGSDYNSRTGTLTFAPGQTTKTVTVGVKGDTLDEFDETFFVNLSSVTNAALADAQGVGIISDDDALPTISVNNVTVLEGNSGTVNATFTVALSAASGKKIVVGFRTANNDAVAPGDFTAVTLSNLTFIPGVTSLPITVTVNGDTLDEVNETFILKLSTPNNAVFGNAQGRGTITDNDPAPALTINDINFAEGTGPVTNAAFTVTLSPASGRSVTVNYATVNGTATAAQDYNARSGTVTFAPGQTSKSLTVGVKGDALFENDETFKISLSGAVNANIADNQGVCTIIDDDPPGNLAVSADEEAGPSE